MTMTIKINDRVLAGIEKEFGVVVRVAKTSTVTGVECDGLSCLVRFYDGREQWIDRGWVSKEKTNDYT